VQLEIQIVKNLELTTVTIVALADSSEAEQTH